MADFIRADLRGSRFEHVDLSGAQLRAVDLTGVVMRNVELAGADIHGEIGNLTINGVDIGPLVDAELDRRYPDRAKMRPADPAGFREAWEVLERLWGQSVERARRLPPELLHESVDGEWSFIETLRHLVFVTDAWSGGRSSATRRRGIPWTCHGTRCLTRRGSPATAAHGPRWRPCSNCAATGCPPCGRSSRA
jgi:Pentapeptide repeats (8 copies)/DinB superfamily